MSKAINNFLQQFSRRTATVTYGCFAHPCLFLPWEKMIPSARHEFNANGPIPCEGGGVPGEWCMECRFGKEISRDEE